MLWQCWPSGQSWWKGWWSLGPFVLRGPTRFGCVKMERGRRCWWMTCYPVTTTATSSFPRSEECGDSLKNGFKITQLLTERIEFIFKHWELCVWCFSLIWFNTLTSVTLKMCGIHSLLKAFNSSEWTLLKPWIIIYYFNELKFAHCVTFYLKGLHSVSN